LAYQKPVEQREALRRTLDICSRGATLNYMVKYSTAPLDRTFAALADPTRRALLARLAAEPNLSVSALAEPFDVSLPAIMKHLDVLSDAGLVARTKSGRIVSCRLNAEPMRGAREWLERYERFWSEALHRLAGFLEEEESCPSKPSSNQASPLSGTSRRRPPKSSPRSPTRKR
jgi:DNA-binding transcriptional ArsR family regulator